MRILVIIHEFPPIGGGGGPIARDLSAEWVKNGHQVRIISAHYGDLPHKEIWNGIEIIRLSSFRTEPFRAKMKAMTGFILSAVWYCLFKMKDFQPDMIHVHFAVPGGPVALLVSKLKKSPYVRTVHLGDIPGASPEKTGQWFRFVRPLTPPIWKQAAKVIAVSEYSRKIALETYNVPIQVIPNGVDYQKIKASSVQLHAVPQIVFAGRFVPQKNLNQIIRTCEKIKDLPWHCTLIGEGQDKDSIITLIQAAGLEDRFSIPGWKTPEEVIDIFKNSDILFLPSKNEGLPVVGIQAMSCGLALILSSAGGNPEIVTVGENGFIEEPEDTNGFVRDLSLLLQESEMLMRFRKNSIEFAQRFDMKKTAEAYEKVFFEVLQPSSH